MKTVDKISLLSMKCVKNRLKLSWNYQASLRHPLVGFCAFAPRSWAQSLGCFCCSLSALPRRTTNSRKFLLVAGFDLSCWTNPAISFIPTHGFIDDSKSPVHASRFKTVHNCQRFALPTPTLTISRRVVLVLRQQGLHRRHGLLLHQHWWDIAVMFVRNLFRQLSLAPFSCGPSCDALHGAGQIREWVRRRKRWRSSCSIQLSLDEDLIKWGWPEDVWFHVDKVSSAHVYLRLNKVWN